MSTISQEESLLLQCLATTSLLGELSNANFLESDYYKQLSFSNKNIKNILTQFGLRNPATMQMMLYALLMKKCNIDCTKHVWHDLRHTYATLLDQNNMNMKVVSEILGHYSEEFTNEVYVIHKPEVIIYDTSEVMNSFIESLKLDSTERTIPVYDISFIQEYLF